MLTPPPSAGSVLRTFLIEHHETQTAFAARIRVGRVALCRVICGRAPLSVQMAMRLERAGCGAAEYWLALQSAFAAFKERHRHGGRVRIEPIAPLETVN